MTKYYPHATSFPEYLKIYETKDESDWMRSRCFHRYIMRYFWEFQKVAKFVYYIRLKTYEENHMAHKFINVQLSEKDKPRLEAYAEHYNGDAVEMAYELTAQGYKLSISWIDDRNSFCVTVSGSKRTKFNKEHSMTSWSDDLTEACFMAGYKHEELAKKGDWEGLHVSTTWG